MIIKRRKEVPPTLVIGDIVEFHLDNSEILKYEVYNHCGAWWLHFKKDNVNNHYFIFKKLNIKDPQTFRREITTYIIFGKNFSFTYDKEVLRKLVIALYEEIEEKRLGCKYTSIQDRFGLMEI